MANAKPITTKAAVVLIISKNIAAAALIMSAAIIMSMKTLQNNCWIWQMKPGWKS